jgi:hypothetical protein
MAKPIQLTCHDDAYHRLLTAAQGRGKTTTIRKEDLGLLLDDHVAVLQKLPQEDYREASEA